MDPGAGRWIRVRGVKFPPDLAFRVCGETHDQEIGPVAWEKAEGPEGFQGGEGQGTQVPARPRAGVNVSAIFRFYHRHAQGGRRRPRRDGGKCADLHAVEQGPGKQGKGGLEKSRQGHFQQSRIQAEPSRVSSRRCPA